jgi:type III pantothenate kinase
VPDAACWAATWPATRCSRRVEEQLELWDLEPRWIVSSAAQAGGVVNGYDYPGRLGADRFVASLIGARQRVLAEVGPGGRPRPALVVMVGTAVTVDALDPDGRFLGGLILPGFGHDAAGAGRQGTAGLRVPTGEVVDFPTNTSDALMSGGSSAIAGAIERHAPPSAAAHRPEPADADDRRRRLEGGALAAD